MSSSDNSARTTLEKLKLASMQRLLADAAELHSKGQLKSLPLQPGQSRPEPRELRIKSQQ
ncbi:MAG: hypothetical protein AAB403_15555 [Planctomycetota bacterium]